jgi:hypothetical protein
MSWAEIAGFCLAALVSTQTFLLLLAFAFPNGEISKRIHPPPDPDIMALLVRRVDAMQLLLLQGQHAPPVQPHPLEDVELVTTMRSSPRRRRADNIVDGLRGPGP